MKKILLSTIVLTAFALSIILFEISCKKTAVAAGTSNTTTATQQNKIIYLKEFFGGVSGNPVYDHGEIWTANYDGSNQQKLNVTLPSGVVVVLSPGSIKLSPDGKTIFFTGFSPGNNYPTTSTPWSIYSCNIDGSNVNQVVSCTSSVETSVAF